MMKDRLMAAICCVVMVTAGAVAHAQNLGGRWLVGFNFGPQRFIANQNDSATVVLPGGNTASGRVSQAGYGIGVAAVLERRFSSRFGLGLSLGYATLPFHLRLTSPSFSVESSLRTQFLYSELLFDYELINRNLFRPYLMLGAGYLDFQVSDSKRLHAGKSMIGVGARFMIRPQMLLNAGAAYNFQGSDNLDAASNGKHDAFVSARIGVSFFKDGAEAAQKNLFSGRENRVVQTKPGAGKAIRRTANPAPLPVEKKNGPAATSNTNKAGAASSPTPTSFAMTYEQALQSIYAQQYEQAIQRFSRLIANHPSHVLISNCHYWLGRAYFGLKNYQPAITSFTHALTSPRFSRRDDALFMLGNCWLQINQRDEARQALRRLVQDYPDSKLAVKAKELLAKM